MCLSIPLRFLDAITILRKKKFKISKNWHIHINIHTEVTFITCGVENLKPSDEVCVGMTS